MTAAHELLEQLVAFPSVAGRPNDEVAEFLAAGCAGMASSARRCKAAAAA